MMCMVFLQLLLLSASMGAHPQNGEHRRRGSAALRAQIRREIAAMRSGLASYRATHPTRGDFLRAPLRTVADLWITTGRVPSKEAAQRLGLTMAEGKMLIDLSVDPAQRDGALEGLRFVGVQQMPTDSAESTRVVAVASDLDRLAEIPGVQSASVPRSLQPAAFSEGLLTTGALIWQSFVPYPGMSLTRPVKVAVMDGGFQGYEVLLGGELPAAVETAAFCGVAPPDIHGCASLPPTDHGTAVAEIVHDMSPNAELLLIAINLVEDTSKPGSSWQQALEYAESHRADIISTSLGTIWDNRDGGSSLCDTAASLRHSHVVWAASAGNGGNACTHEHYPFVSSKVSLGAPYGSYQAFGKGGDPILNEFILGPGQTHYVALSWNAWGHPPSDDFDLFYVCDFGGGYQVVSVSEDLQCGVTGTLPFEAVGYFNGSAQALPCAYGVVEFDPVHCRHAATGVQFDTWSYVDDGVQGNPESCVPMEEATSSYTLAHPADCPDVQAVGAICVHGAQSETYSGRGPTLDGRNKPDFCAPDAVSTTTYGSSLACPGWGPNQAVGFIGTSASAPHFAGALALLYEKLGGVFSVQQCRAILAERAQKVDAAGENPCGHGRLCMDERGCD